ncbi:MAG: cytochrome c [Saprospiraceae bacterium]|jgi:cytochrome c551/c552|nr:cytochrome c [Saprospiraceae bacterium]MBP9209306.1 cytochrome c [Saprospiraceae bacterium]MBV6474286.1 hypothetical protein [Saprospiraceae bacterium]
MKINILSAAIAFCFLFSFVGSAHAQADAKTLFKDYCKACHTIDQGKLVGPELKNIHEKRSEEWLIKWIRNPQAMLDAKDPDAIAIWEQFNKVPMTPNPNMTDDDIRGILAYIKEQSSPAPAAAATPAAAADSAAGAAAAAPASGSGWFSMPFNLLLAVILVLLVVIYYLSNSVRRLTDQLSDFYHTDRSFFK